MILHTLNNNQYIFILDKECYYYNRIIRKSDYTDDGFSYYYLYMHEIKKCLDNNPKIHFFSKEEFNRYKEGYMIAYNKAIGIISLL